MKYLIAIGILLILTAGALRIGTRFGDRRTSFNVNENSKYYRIEMHFNKSRTHDLRKVMHRELSINGLHRKKEIDATIKLDDNTRFSFYSSPGTIRIRFNKRENTAEAYEWVKTLSGKLKEALLEEREG